MAKMMIYQEANSVLESSLTPNNRCICKKTAIDNHAIASNLTAFVNNRLVPASMVVLISYTIQFVDWDNTVLSTQIVKHGHTPTLPTNPTRDGYIFTGWSNNPNSAINSDTVFVAQYSVRSYIISFVDYNGSLLKEQTCSYMSIPTPPSNPTRTGYWFTGWSPSISPVTGPQTYTAQYEKSTITVRFIDGVTSGVISTQEVEPGGFATAPPAPNHTSQNWHFVEWNPNPESTPINQPTDFTANYQYHSEHYKITWNYIDPDTNEETFWQMVSYNYKEPLRSMNPPTIPSYTFAGWDPTPPIGSPVVADAKYVGSFTEGGSGYKHTWNHNDDGNHVTYLYYMDGDRFNTWGDLRNQDKLGYSFQGWSTQDYNGVVPQEGTAVHENATFNAEWQQDDNPEIYYTIHWYYTKEPKANGEANIWKTTTVNVNPDLTQNPDLLSDPVADPGIPTIDGKTFKRWDRNIIGERITGDTGVYAVWEGDPDYTVKWKVRYPGYESYTLYKQDGYVAGDQLVVPSDPQDITGSGQYTFLGWIPNTSNYPTVNEDLEFFGSFGSVSYETFNIDLDFNGGTVNKDGRVYYQWNALVDPYARGIVYEYGQSFAGIPNTLIPEKDGKVFDGWDGLPEEGTPIYRDYTGVARWEDPEVETYSVYWIVLYPDNTREVWHSQVDVEYGTTLTWPNTDPTYYSTVNGQQKPHTFNGWAAENVQGGQIPNTVTGNITIKGNFSLEPETPRYRVEFLREPTDQTGNYSPGSTYSTIYADYFDEGAKVHVPSPDYNEITVYTGDINNPTVTTKTFTGWQGGYVTYNSGDTETQYNTITVSDDITIYAQYETSGSSEYPKEVTIEAEYTDTNGYASQAGNPSLVVNISDADNNNYGQQTITIGNQYTWRKTVNNQEQEQREVTLTWSCNGESGTQTLHWTDSFGLDLSEVYTPPVNPGGGGDQTEKHTVTWHFGNGDADRIDEYNDAEILRYPDDPTRPGYIFERWDGDVQYINDYVYTDREYTAIWRIGTNTSDGTYIVRWKFKDGTPTLSETYNEGDLINIPRGTADDWDPDPNQKFPSGVDDDALFEWIGDY